MTIRLLFTALWSLVFVSFRRAFRGPLWPDWPWRFEYANDYLKRQTRQAANLPDVASQRRYADTLVYSSPALERVTTEAEAVCPVPATWYLPPDLAPRRVVLYPHGGGWAFFSKAHQGLIANIALATRARTLAVDYRLSPEHPYPAALHDCLAAYRHLLEIGAEPLADRNRGRFGGREPRSGPAAGVARRRRPAACDGVLGLTGRRCCRWPREPGRT